MDGTESKPMTLLQPAEQTDVCKKGAAVPGAKTEWGQPHLVHLVTATTWADSQSTAPPDSVACCPFLWNIYLLK